MKKGRILIIGGFNTARSLAVSLLDREYQVTVINQNKADCLRLAETDGLNVICGDGSKPYILGEAAGPDIDAAIALTSRDDTNLVICELCKKRFNVKRAVCLVKNSENRVLFKKLGVDATVCATDVITGIIEKESLLDTIHSVVSTDNGRIKVTEVSIDEQSPVTGSTLSELLLPPDVIIGCILRQNRNIVPSGDTKLRAGDLLVLLSQEEKEKQALRILRG
ncbi:MAG: potassium channel family protein [Eubacteriaceae bacterium]|jgi:trk system potassium uptake protein TrkA